MGKQYFYPSDRKHPYTHHHDSLTHSLTQGTEIDRGGCLRNRRQNILWSILWGEQLTERERHLNNRHWRRRSSPFQEWTLWSSSPHTDRHTHAQLYVEGGLWFSKYFFHIIWSFCNMVSVTFVFFCGNLRAVKTSLSILTRNTKVRGRTWTRPEG